MTVCPYCQQRPVAHRKGARTCGALLCRRAQNRQVTAQRMREAYRRPFRDAPTVRLCERHESVAQVDRQLAQARAARLAEERRTGQRRYTTDPWQQRQSHYSNPGADEQGDGWS